MGKELGSAPPGGFPILSKGRTSADHLIIYLMARKAINYLDVD
jgi:hypothetical protein